MIDIYTSRRNRPYKCLYWKRDNLYYQNNEELKHRKVPSGIFYASVVSRKEKEKQDIVNVFHNNYETISLETEDKVDITQDDKVLFNDEIWLVLRVSEEYKTKNAFYLKNISKKTIIYITRG